MQRRKHIEDIVIGTLAATFEDYWPDVRTTLTEESFADELNRRVFRTMTELKVQGEEVNLITITKDMRREDTLAIIEKAASRDFDYMKWEWNFVNRPRHTDVTFEDYVNRLLTYQGQ